MNKSLTLSACLALVIFCCSCFEMQANKNETALNDPNSRRRMNAISSSTPLDVLVKICRNEKEEDIRHKAVSYIFDHNILLEIVQKKEETALVRGSALRRLNDPQLAIKFAANIEDKSIRPAAVECIPIAEQKLLENYAENDPDYMVRFYAIPRIKNQDLIFKILKNEKHNFVRLAAAESLLNQNYISELIFSESDEKVKSAMVRNLYRIDLLTKLALTDSDRYNRGTAASKLSDQKILEKIVEVDPESFPREKAIVRLKNIEIIEKVAAADPQENVRKAAISVLTNKELLKSIYKNDPELRIRCAAENRLKEIAK